MEFLTFNSGVVYRIPINYSKLEEYGLTEQQLMEIINFGKPEITSRWTTPVKDSKGLARKKKKVVLNKTMTVGATRTL